MATFADFYRKKSSYRRFLCLSVCPHVGPRGSQHRTGSPILPKGSFPMTTAGMRCGRSPKVTETLDCLTCGACCFQRPGTILISERDLVRFQRLNRAHILKHLEPGHFGQMSFSMSSQGCCVHHGTPGEPHACQIYEDRSDTCRDFQSGSPQCLEFRRDRGIDPPRNAP